ncbi:MAG: hypothetical protein WEE64_01775 [Dehalococcoidia bacterium]
MAIRSTSGRSIPAAFWLALTLFASIALVAGACGGGGGSDPTPTAEEEAPTDEPTSDATEDTVQIDESFWHSGWMVTLGEATVTTDDLGARSVAIEATFENLGTDTATFDSQLVLTSGGNSYTETGTEQELPEVPGELSGSGVLAIRVDDEFTFDDATLTIGNPANNQAVVPLGPDGDDLVTLEPREIAVSGDVTAGAVRVTVERAELRADLPDAHSIMEEGKLALTVYFSVTPSAGIQIGQGVFQDPNVALKLPDGTAVAVRSDGVSGVNELLQGKEGTTISGLSVRFEVNEPAEGQYAFVVRGAYGPGGAQAEGELPFTIVAVAAGASPTAGPTPTP